MRALAALVGGLLLAASDQPWVLWPLQFVALIPLWWALLRQPIGSFAAAGLGALFALAYSSLLLLVAGLALPILVAAAAGVVQWLLAAALAARLLRCGPVHGALATAAMLTLLELLVWYAVPMFGTAQCFVRPLSAAPQLVAFVAFTGVGGVVFVSAAVQALLAAGLRERTRGPWLAAAALLAIVAALDGIRLARPAGPRVPLAAMGWGETIPGDDRYEVYDRAFAAAARANAKLVVTPETGLWLHDATRERTLTRLGESVRRHGVPAALGVWHSPTTDNRIWFFDGQGSLLGEYRKTHLIPWLEDYVAGDGTVAILPFADTRIGGMICQDDNFTDVARTHGRAGVGLVAVPTNDWPAIRALHLENSVFRTLENGYAVARAASGGISALISARGEVIAYDHVATDTQHTLIGEVELGDGSVTFYARYGDWPLLLLCVGVIALAMAKRLATHAEVATVPPSARP